MDILDIRKKPEKKPVVPVVMLPCCTTQKSWKSKCAHPQMHLKRQEIAGLNKALIGDDGWFIIPHTVSNYFNRWKQISKTYTPNPEIWPPFQRILPATQNSNACFLAILGRIYLILKHPLFLLFKGILGPSP